MNNEAPGKTVSVEDVALRIAENAARAMYEQGLLCGPTRAIIDAELSAGWPKARNMPKPRSEVTVFAHGRVESERPELHLVELFLGEVRPVV